MSMIRWPSQLVIVRYDMVLLYAVVVKGAYSCSTVKPRFSYNSVFDDFFCWNFVPVFVHPLSFRTAENGLYQIHPPARVTQPLIFRTYFFVRQWSSDSQVGPSASKRQRREVTPDRKVIAGRALILKSLWKGIPLSSNILSSSLSRPRCLPYTNKSLQ